MHPPRPRLSTIPTLDGVRALAVVLIVVYHYLYVPTDRSLLPTPLALVHELFGLAWAAMDLFFVLSGFLIGRILMSSRGSATYFGAFWRARAFRILPPYLIVVVPFLVLATLPDARARLPWLLEDPAPGWSYLAFVQNLFMTDGFGANWTGVTWSLALEEQFYLLLPFAVLWLPPRRIVPLCVAGIAIALLLRAGLELAGAPLGRNAGYVLLPMRMDALLVGVLIARLHLDGTLEPWMARRGLLRACALVASVALIGYARFGRAEGLGGPLIHAGFVLGSAWLMIECLVAHHRARGGWVRPLGWAPARWLAAISYTVYLLHQPVQGLVHGLALGRQPSIDGATGLLATAASLLLVLCLATLSWRYYERPLRDLGRRAIARRASAEGSTSPSGSGSA